MASNQINPDHEESTKENIIYHERVPNWLNWMPASAVQDLIRLWEKDTKAEKCRGRIAAHELIELTHSMEKEGRIIVAKWIVSREREMCEPLQE